MADSLGPILTAIISLLEGESGDALCAMPSGRFKRVEHVETIGTRGASRRPRPFSVAAQRNIPPSGPGLTSGTHVCLDRTVVLDIAYATMRNKEHELEVEMLEDDFDVRRVLEWGPNWLTDGWEGCSVVDVSDVAIGDGDYPDLILRSHELQVSYREQRL